MADAVWTLQKATPHSSTYKIVGGATPGVRDAPTLISDAAKGPLKRLFVRLNTGGGLFQRLNLDSAGSLPDTKGLVRIYLVTGVDFAQALPPTAINVKWQAASISASVPAASQLFVEIRLVHSVAR